MKKMIFILGFLTLGFTFSNANIIGENDENGNEKNTECTVPANVRCKIESYRTSCGRTVTIDIGADGNGNCIEKEVQKRYDQMVCEAELRMCGNTNCKNAPRKLEISTNP